MCENGDTITHIQRDVFLNAKFGENMVNCEEIADISLEPWRNCCEENVKGLCEEPAYLYVPIESQLKARAKREQEIFESIEKFN